MRTKSLYLLWLVHVSCIHREPERTPPQGHEVVHLVKVQSATQTDTSRIGPGGFEARIKSGTLQNRYLRNCSSAVAETTLEWGKRHGLTLELYKKGERRFVGNFSSTVPTNIFEIYYEFAKDGSHADLSVDQYALKNSEFADLQKYHINEFVESLLAKISCE